MKARVKKTGRIVEVVRKQDNYFIDSESNPYKEEELDFEVGANEIVDALSESADQWEQMPNITKIFGMYSSLGVQIAIQYMSDHPDAPARSVCRFVNEVMEMIKKL